MPTAEIPVVIDVSKQQKERKEKKHERIDRNERGSERENTKFKNTCRAQKNQQSTEPCALHSKNARGFFFVFIFLYVCATIKEKINQQKYKQAKLQNKNDVARQPQKTSKQEKQRRHK